MPDIADDANERTEAYLDTAVRERKPEGPAAIGECLACTAPLSPPRRWCDGLCRDEWQREQRRMG